MSAAAAAALVPDGASVGLGRPEPLALVRELVRQGRRDLDLVAVPTGGLGAELLIAAGAVRSLESSGIDLGEHGFAPAFSEAVLEGRLRVLDSTCPALLMALQAGASGIPFTPVPGLLGTDLMARRPDYRELEDPYHAGRRIALVPALAPDYALVHGRRADLLGNVVIGTDRDDRLLIQAARTVVVSVEKVEPGAADHLGPGEQSIPAAYVDALALAPSAESEAEAIRAYLRDRAERAHALQR